MREDSFDLGSYDPEMDGYEPPEVSVDDVTMGDRIGEGSFAVVFSGCLLYTSPSPRDGLLSRMPSSA